MLIKILNVIKTYVLIQVEPGGVVRDPAVHRQVIKSVTAGFEDAGFRCDLIFWGKQTGNLGGLKKSFYE